MTVYTALQLLGWAHWIYLGGRRAHAYAGLNLHVPREGDRLPTVCGREISDDFAQAEPVTECCPDCVAKMEAINPGRLPMSFLAACVEILCTSAPDLNADPL